MKINYLLLSACLIYLFTACKKPDFDLNASYEKVTVVYGVLNYQDSIHYVKIYKGFQSHGENQIFINAQNPDSIYYYDQINVILQEWHNGARTARANIPLQMTRNFPRDAGFFYYGDERIIYYTTDTLSKYLDYKIRITHKTTGEVIEAQTPMVGDARVLSTLTEFKMMEPKGRVRFEGVPSVGDNGYEIHVNFVYFEVDKTNQAVKIGRVRKNITPRVGEEIGKDYAGNFAKEFPQTFYEDIAAELERDNNVTRYMGLPGNNGSCIEIEIWAAGKSFMSFLLSNQPTNSFVQVNTIYTNIETPSGGLAFGFLSSRSKSQARYFTVTAESEQELISGPLTGHLGFRPWTEYKP
ncbi:MAG: hypothetical protein FWC34_08220 [Bacteroidetes bacterium]|nr:hypothetical protein [Bacteroidota bacterium]MCL2302389.1 hypothetical protein [Lentimicrobiaceae bacterium]